MAKQPAIVTRDSLREMVSSPNLAYVEAVVGRALVRIFERQTEAEKRSNDTNVNNNIGFAGCDAKSGSLTAKYYMKHKHLESWQLEKWLKVDAAGYPRICKYHRQLNEIALVAQQNKLL